MVETSAVTSTVSAAVLRAGAGQFNLDGLGSGRFQLKEINDAFAGVRSNEAIRNVIVFPEGDEAL